MTEQNRYFNKNGAFLSYITAFLILVLLCHSREVSEGVYCGALFAAKCLIPTLFPFFIIGDMIFAFGLPFDTFLKKRGLYVILIGILCGFPHGARCATRLFEDGKISADEYERLLILSNGPSLAFVVAGIGAGMIGSVTCGAILFIAHILSVIILSLIKKTNAKISSEPPNVRANRFNLVESIKNAGTSSITITSFVTFFYGINALISHLFKGKFLSRAAAIFLEIGMGSVSIASDKSLPIVWKMTLLGFTVGFSSMSVFMQCSVFISEKVSKKKLLAFKIIQGILCAIFAFLLTLTCKKWLF